MKRVAILGCGPAGLLAAHAAQLMRIDAIVISKPEKSVINGAQYLHQHIPGLTEPEPEGVIKVVKFGDERGYAAKVYGRADAPTSFNQFVGQQPAWSLARAYDTLWDLYGGDHVCNEDLMPTSVAELMYNYDLVISSIPAPSLCYNKQVHSFSSASVGFIHSAGPRMGSFMEPWENWIAYSGRPEDAWYRMSSIFGEGQTEFSMANFESSPDYVGAKPISTDCDCLRQVKRIGRFGQWKKGVLTHHAFQEACDALQQL